MDANVVRIGLTCFLTSRSTSSRAVSSIGRPINPSLPASRIGREFVPVMAMRSDERAPSAISSATATPAKGKSIAPRSRALA